jgi:LacI family gluconate utilization system Gnt-I transcriptional repressor
VATAGRLTASASCVIPQVSLIIARPPRGDENPLNSPKRKRSKRPARSYFGDRTIGKVAVIAGVSKATVSRFFNSPGLLSRDTSARVEQAIQRVGYIPNLLAGALTTKRTGLIAAVIPSIAQSIFSSTIQSVTDALAAEGYSVLLALTGSNDEYARRQVMSVVGRRPDGIILTGASLDAETRAQLRATRIPTIETWDLPDDPIDLAVGFSHAKVGAAVAKHALARGRKRTLVISATGARALERCRSFTQTMTGQGAPPPALCTFEGTTTFGKSRRALAAHLDGGGRPELVFCSSDIGAHGVIAELHERGIRIPDDIAVIGFGDLDFAADLAPSLTTVKIDGSAIAQKTAEFLLLRARKKRIANPIVDIGFELIVRSSG